MIRKLWRWLVGDPYVVWVIDPPAYRTYAYMDAGVRMYWLGAVLYIHRDDQPLAVTIDYRLPRGSER